MTKIKHSRAALLVALCLTLAVLQISPALAQPVNDDFDDALVIPGLPFTDSIDTSDATAASDDPVPSCVETSHTVWYQFTPTETMHISANTFGSDYDTTLSVFTGERGSLTEVACNDDTFDVQSRVTFEAQAGEAYHFMAGSFFDSPGGELVFNLDMAGPPLEFDLSVDPTGSVKPSTGVVVITGQVECSRQAFVDIFLVVEQRIGRFIIRGFGGEIIEDCDGITSWSITVVGENGLFVGGKVDVSAFAFAFSGDGEEAFDEEFLTVKLQGRSSH